MRFPLLLLAILLSASLAAACSDSNDDDGEDGDDTPAAEATSTELPDGGVEPTATVSALEAFSLPDTTVSASLTTTYKTGQADPPADDELPVPSGAVEARWYQSNGQYVVHYAGLSLVGSDALCPGNSIETSTGFEHVTNAPTAPGACTGADAFDQTTLRVLFCDGEVLYLTAIPVDVEGTLYGTIERYLDDGTIVGLTSMVTADQAAAPEVDLRSCALASS